MTNVIRSLILASISVLGMTVAEARAERFRVERIRDNPMYDRDLDGMHADERIRIRERTPGFSSWLSLPLPRTSPGTTCIVLLAATPLFLAAASESLFESVPVRLLIKDTSSAVLSVEAILGFAYYARRR